MCSRSSYTIEAESLAVIGRTLDVERRDVMLRRDLGLTTLYNLINDPHITDASDPDVARMRAIHVELDHAVMDAYGWSDIALNHGFHTYAQMQRWTVSPAARVEILDRLLRRTTAEPRRKQSRRRRHEAKAVAARAHQTIKGHCCNDQPHRESEGTARTS